MEVQTRLLCLDLTLVWMMMLSCITGLSVTLKWRRYKTKSRIDNYGWHGIRTKTIYTSIIPVSSKPWIASLCSPTPHQPWASATAPQDAQAWKHWGEYELKTQSFNCKRNSCQSGQLQTDPCGICLQCAPGVCSFFLASANFSTVICDIKEYSRTMRSSGLMRHFNLFDISVRGNLRRIWQCWWCLFRRVGMSGKWKIQRKKSVLIWDLFGFARKARHCIGWERLVENTMLCLWGEISTW